MTALKNNMIKDIIESTNVVSTFNDAGWSRTSYGEAEELVVKTVKAAIEAIDDGDGQMSTLFENTWRQRCVREILAHFGMEIK